MVIKTLESEGIPFQVFEGWRSPQRQQFLWEQGRTRPGGIVTKARAWQSFHQYGLAADVVLFESGRWSWDTSGHRAAWWARLHEAGRQAGLEPLSFEQPHLQLQGCTLGALQEGRYPSGADDAWAENLLAAICTWSGFPAAPPRPPETVERPPLPTPSLSETPREPSLPVTFFEAAWHSCFDGQEWRCDAGGIYTRESDPKPLRTAGQPVTMRRVWDLFGEPITEASRAHGVDRALIMMVIATETGVFRDYGFTGPMTFRWEPTVKVADLSPIHYGDYSAGPMQILATTARDVIRRRRLAYDPLQVAPPFESRPAPPMTLPLYQAPANIDIGTAVISQNWARTDADPILVAAAYNAGGVYKSGANAWRLRSCGDHLDRAARWYGDACGVLKEVDGTR